MLSLKINSLGYYFFHLYFVFNYFVHLIIWSVQRSAAKVIACQQNFFIYLAVTNFSNKILTSSPSKYIQETPLIKRHVCGLFKGSAATNAQENISAEDVLFIEVSSPFNRKYSLTRFQIFPSRSIVQWVVILEFCFFPTPPF